MNLTRRSVLLTSASAVAATGIAGCSRGQPGASGDSNGYAAFFPLWDWAETVGGDRFSFENPVGVGRMGHGWNPPGDVTRNIASSDVFIYLDTPEFAWAQDVAVELERDYDDVVTVDLFDGLESELLRADAEQLPEPDRGHAYPPETLRLSTFGLFDLRSNDQLGEWHEGHWHGGFPDVELDDSVPVGIVLRDDEDRVVPLGADEPYQVDARIADGESEAVLEVESHGSHVELFGRAVGRTAIVVQIRRGEELIHETVAEPAPVEVLETIEHDHEDVFYDPHAWVDPILAQGMVDTIADTLSTIDPDGQDVYRSNAEAYNDRLEAVHRQFEELVDRADREVVILAAHDSFGYLQRRYGIDFRTPTGVSADAVESIDDVATLIDAIENHDVETVLYDPFEAPNPGEDLPQIVDVLFEHTSVEYAEPLSPIEGTTAAWNDRGWGWIEQMEEMNLPSLRRALGAT